VSAGPGDDSIDAGHGDDEIDLSGGGTDAVTCGRGRDIVWADPTDVAAKDCSPACSAGSA